MQIITFVTDVGSIQPRRATDAPRIAPAARGPPQGEEDLDAGEVDTFALNEPLPWSTGKRCPTSNLPAGQGAYRQQRTSVEHPDR